MTEEIPSATDLPVGIVDGGAVIVAKDSVKGYVLYDGLGVLRVGRMWFKEEQRHRELPGYDQIPEQDSAGGFGVQTVEDLLKDR